MNGKTNKEIRTIAEVTYHAILARFSLILPLGIRIRTNRNVIPAISDNITLEIISEFNFESISTKKNPDTKAKALKVREIINMSVSAISFNDLNFLFFLIENR